MHGPTCTFWGDLTPASHPSLSLEDERGAPAALTVKPADVEASLRQGGTGALAATWESHARKQKRVGGLRVTHHQLGHILSPLARSHLGLLAINIGVDTGCSMVLMPYLLEVRSASRCRRSQSSMGKSPPPATFLDDLCRV
jgi:hypothetical protein